MGGTSPDLSRVIRTRQRMRWLDPADGMRDTRNVKRRAFRVQKRGIRAEEKSGRAERDAHEVRSGCGSG
jgi:hypothetical protein